MAGLIELLSNESRFISFEFKPRKGLLFGLLLDKGPFEDVITQLARGRRDFEAALIQ